MQALANTQQAHAWNGYEGRRWADHQERWDAVNHGANDSLFAAASIGERDRVLDIGRGNGQTSRLAASRAPRGQVVGIDLSQPMLERARASTSDEGLANVRFEQGNAQVYPFASGAFDVAISRFGIMFFADPVAAFRNIRRALRPQGRLACVCMGDMRNTDLGAAFSALTSHTPGPAAVPSAGDGPLSLADPERIRDVLEGAGFDSVSTTPIQFTMAFGRTASDAAQFLLGTGPVHASVEHADELTVQQARDALTDALRPLEQGDAFRVRGSHWLVSATSGS